MTTGTTIGTTIGTTEPLRLREADTGFVNELGAMSGVDHVVLVSYNGDYMG